MRHDGRDRGGGTVNVGIGGPQGALRLGQGCQLESGLGDQRKRSFRTDDESREIVADHALGGQHAGAKRLASSIDGPETQGIVARSAVFDRSRTGRVVGEVAADGTGRRAGGIRRPEEAGRLHRLLQARIEDTRLHDRQTVGGGDAQDPVHALEGEDDTATIGDRGAGGSGAAPARGQRNPGLAAEFDQRRDLGLVRREHHRLRQGMAAAVVVAVRPAVGRIGQQATAAGDSGE